MVRIYLNFTEKETLEMMNCFRTIMSELHMTLEEALKIVILRSMMEELILDREAINAILVYSLTHNKSEVESLNILVKKGWDTVEE